MDYETKETSRKELRLFAILFRTICNCKSGPINPVELLDRLPDLEGFQNVRYEIVYGNTLPGNVPAQCIPVDDGYIIQIKENVYEGAYKNKVGGYRMHIMHEIMHVFADKIGFKPVFERSLTKRIPSYKSLEWIVKALAGEVMMPYDETQNMSKEELMDIYGVSKAAAEMRLKY